MQYPRGFPPDSQDRVERALIAAEQLQRDALAALPLPNDRHTDSQKRCRQQCAEAVVIEVFPVLANEVLTHWQRWTLSGVGQMVDASLDALLLHAYRHTELHIVSAPRPSEAWGSSGGFLP